MVRVRHMLPGLLLWAASASADTYWINYEGDDFPERVGPWVRHTRFGGDDRRIENGALVLDGLRDPALYDFYEINRQIDAGPGEMFISSWRLNVLQNVGDYDAAVAIARDHNGTLSFAYSLDHIFSTREGWSYPIVAQQFHVYTVESSDMLNYSLFIDGEHIHDGRWDLNSLNHSFVNFGDGVEGASSLSEWDFVRFGVVPEPGAFFSLCLLAGGRFGRRSSRQQHNGLRVQRRPRLRVRAIGTLAGGRLG